MEINVICVDSAFFRRVYYQSGLMELTIIDEVESDLWHHMASVNLNE